MHPVPGGKIQTLLASLLWIAWGVYLLSWPVDAIVANLTSFYPDPDKGVFQRLLFLYFTATSYILLAAIGLSLLSVLLWRFGAIRQLPRSGFWPEFTLSPKWHRRIIVLLLSLAILYAISWWLRPFI